MPMSYEFISGNKVFSKNKLFLLLLHNNSFYSQVTFFNHAIISLFLVFLLEMMGAVGLFNVIVNVSLLWHRLGTTEATQLNRVNKNLE